MAVVREKRLINLALQGGGAHGAFTWGALDRLLEEEMLEIDGISGTSAGAMNAAMLKTGLLDGGREGARRQLDRFWGEIKRQASRNVNPVSDWIAMFSPNAGKIAQGVMASPIYQMQDTLSRTLSPYDWNPLNINPLRDMLLDMIDFDAVCKECEPHLFISATNVRSGKIKVFEDDDLSVDMILASACLPNLFQAVEVNGEFYWDGGFMGNPALYPLFYNSTSDDVVIIHVNPIERPDVPRSANQIQNRVNEISFNSSLLRELRTVNFVRRLIAEGRLKPGEMKDVLVHSIRDDETMADLNVATKLSPEPQLFDHLKEAGRAAADAFLRANWTNLGTKSSVDLRAMFD
ncbi:MAG: patatin-like phospholipase family protein [Pseudomonadota bacterium]